MKQKRRHPGPKGFKEMSREELIQCIRDRNRQIESFYRHMRQDYLKHQGELARWQKVAEDAAETARRAVAETGEWRDKAFQYAAGEIPPLQPERKQKRAVPDGWAVVPGQKQD